MSRTLPRARRGRADRDVDVKAMSMRFGIGGENRTTRGKEEKNEETDWRKKQTGNKETRL
jgi:hypothetical protein